MKITNGKIKKLYQDAIFQVFGAVPENSADKTSRDHNDLLKEAIKRDVHIGKTAPGQWSPHSTLEIYCENGLPNATDFHDFSAELAEFGFTGNATCCNMTKWTEVDGIVNLFLEAIGSARRFYHEPYNTAVVNIQEEIPF